MKSYVYFTAEHVFEAMSACVGILGNQLARYYPASAHNEDEIPNRLIFEGED